MCAIAGILSERVLGQSRETALSKMLEQGSRRGPDGQSIWQNDSYSVGHRQLHIMQSPASQNEALQPFVFQDKYVLTWNGSIYNYIELRQELQTKGCVFVSNTDTEVLAQGLATQGLSFLSKINGIFALSFYDILLNKLTLAVDRFGVKPLHYSVHGNQFSFASEIKQLVALHSARPNFDVLVNFLLFNAENYSSQTSFEGVFNLMGGQFIEVDINSKSPKIQYWHSFDWQQSAINFSFDDCVSAFQDRSAHAVRLEQRHAVNQGLGLSAGLDSSWIFHEIKKQHVNVHAFTVGVDRDARDERGRAKKIFNAYATSNDKYTNVAFNADSLIEELDDLSYVQEEPFTDPSVYMQYRMMKIASQQGVRVMLSGQGADELLLGYERYSLLESLPLSVFQQLSYFKKIHSKIGLPLSKYFVFQHLFANASLRISRVKYLHRGMFAEKMRLANTQLWMAEADSYSRLPDLYKNEIEFSHLPKLLRYEDRNGGAFGIEGRQPFLENELSQFLISLPQSFKLKGGSTKQVLRAALARVGMHELAIQKEKIGFNSPNNLWHAAQGDMLDLIQKSRVLKEVYQIMPTTQNKPRMLWKLQSLARWEKMYNL